MLRNILLSGICCFNVLAAAAWGQKGHDVTAFIAENHLTPSTKAVVDSILDGKSIIYWANWMDNASHTPEYNYSRTWHYKNIDADQTYENAPDHQAGNVVTALRREIDILRNPKSDKEDKALALKMIVHFVGDMHQPMHMGHQSDLGGNKVEIKYFDSPVNLHSLWDSRLPEAAHKWSYTEWQQQLDRLSEQEEADVVAGNIDTWAKQSYLISKDIYDSTPKGTKASYDYIAAWTPVVEQQFLNGGLRLAFILNSILDPGFSGHSEF